MKNNKVLLIILGIVIILGIIVYFMFSGKNDDLKLSCERRFDELGIDMKINAYEKKDGLIYDIIETYDVSNFSDEEQEAYQKLVEFELRKYDNITGVDYDVKIKNNKLECRISIDPSVIEITEAASLILLFDDSGDSLSSFDELSTMTISKLENTLESGGFECKEH